MKLPRVRFTMSRMVIAVAVISVGLVPLNDPSRFWLGTLMYFKVGVLITATFLARYGRRRDWWFGFATLGWAHLVLCVPGLWNAIYMTSPQGGFDLLDLAGSSGELLAEWAARPPSGRRYYLPEAAVISFWMTMGVSVMGGYTSMFISEWSKDRETPTKVT